jgi:hypothetical protein
MECDIPILKNSIAQYENDIFNNVSLAEQESFNTIMMKVGKYKLELIKNMKNKGIYISIVNGFKDTIIKASNDGKVIYMINTKVISAYRYALFQSFINLNIKHYECRYDNLYKFSVTYQELQDLYDTLDDIDFEFHYDSDNIYVFIKLLETSYSLNSLLLIDIKKDKYNTIIRKLRSINIKSKLILNDLDLLTEYVKNQLANTLKNILDKSDSLKDDNDYNFLIPNAILKLLKLEDGEDSDI